MTTPGGINIAQDDAQVGVQAHIVHGDIYYQVRPDTSPEQRYRIGVRYLDARMTTQARELIEEAVAQGYDNDEVRFHRLLAVLSGRHLRQLGNEDVRHLEAICGSIQRLDGGDAWRAGSRAVLGLLGSLDTSDTELVVKELDALGAPQRDKIFDHLGVLLEGPLADQLWHRAVDRAKAGRWAHHRAERIRLFFQPPPAEPRVRPVRPASIPAGDWLRAILGGTAFGVAAGAVGWLLIRQSAPGPLLAWLVCTAGAAAAMVGGAERHVLSEQRQAQDARFAPPEQRGKTAPAGGFARSVDRLFDRYFGRYVPSNTNRADWLTQTAGIRRHLRNELVEIYREQRIDAERIAWLVRHLVSDVRQRWENDTLTAYRRHLRTPPAAMALYLGGLAAVAMGAWLAAPSVVRAAPIEGPLWILLAVVSGLVGAAAWFRIAAERRRVAADEAERAEQYAARRTAYDAWQRTLSGKPSDAEVASWLECDRRILVDEAMRQHRLKPSQVIAHAFIEAPAQSYKRARMQRGPWRYSRYQLLLFLLTDDGVRQVNTDLDVEKGVSRVTQRLSYRYDAVTAVRIHGVATQQQTFELTLVNGAPISVRVTESSREDIQPGEDAHTLSKVALDASGLLYTLTILEGIAAEGKEWIKHQRRWADSRLAELAGTIAQLGNPRTATRHRPRRRPPGRGSDDKRTTRD